MNLITEAKLRALIRNRLLEGFQQDFEALQQKFPQHRGELQQLNKPKWVSWLMDRFITGRIKEQFPIEHAIDSLLSFSRNEMSIGAKWKSNEAFRTKALEQIGLGKQWQNPTDITKMTATEMDILNELVSQKKQNVDISKTTEDQVQGDFLGKVGPWNLWMPTTRENSCRIGAGTTWCTARTSGSNLFLSYVARPNENIVLFYVIKDEAETKEDRLSIGFTNGKPNLGGGFGGLSVDANNSGLTKAKLQKIFGDDFERILSILNKKSKSISGQHPAKAKMIEAAQDVELLKNLTKGLSVDEKIDFYQTAVSSGSRAGVDISDVLNFLVNSDDDRVKLVVLNGGNKIPENILLKLATNSNANVRKHVAMNPKTPEGFLAKLASDEDEGVRFLVAKNKNTPEHILSVLANDDNSGVRSEIARNPKATKEILDKLSEDENVSVRRGVVDNFNVTGDLLTKLSYDESTMVLTGIIYRSNVPVEVLTRLAKHPDKSVANAAQNALKNR
jgi:hypothetical protein